MRHAAFATFVALPAASPALAQTWVQFDVRGFGPGQYWDLDGYTSGTYRFHASFGVEIDPGSGDFSDGFSNYGFYQSDGRYFEKDGIESGAAEYWLRASVDGGTFNFSYSICPAAGNVACSSFGGTLTYAPDTFAGGLPDHLPTHLWDGGYSFDLAGHYQDTNGTGRITFARAHVVDGDAGVSFDANPVPEPATWALALSGFGLIGGTLRYRRRSAIRFA